MNDRFIFLVLLILGPIVQLPNAWAVQGHILTRNRQQNEIVVIMSQQDAEPFPPGKTITITLANQPDIKGQVMSRSSWFHRTTLKIKVATQDTSDKHYIAPH